MADPIQESLIREVDEDLRRDRLLSIWRRYGKFVIAGLVAFVLGVAGFEIWRNYERSAREASAERFQEAEGFAATDPGLAADAFESLATEGAPGYSVLARFRAAAVMGSQGRTDEAVREYQRIQSESDDPIYRDLAVILEVHQHLSQGSSVTDPGALAAKLGPLAAEQQPWRHSARELLAIIAINSGDVVGAREHVESLIADPEAPPAARARAAELLAALG